MKHQLHLATDPPPIRTRATIPRCRAGELLQLNRIIVTGGRPRLDDGSKQRRPEPERSTGTETVGRSRRPESHQEARSEILAHRSLDLPRPLHPRDHLPRRRSSAFDLGHVRRTSPSKVSVPPANLRPKGSRISPAGSRDGSRGTLAASPAHYRPAEVQTRRQSTAPSNNSSSRQRGPTRRPHQGRWDSRDEDQSEPGTPVRFGSLRAILLGFRKAPDLERQAILKPHKTPKPKNKKGT